MGMMDVLAARAAKRGPVCFGLDDQEKLLPGCIREGKGTLGEKFFAYNKLVVDAVGDDCACFKVQLAYYEALGLDGMQAFAKTVSYIRSKGIPVIGDGKRGDIYSTQEMYGRAYFTGDFEVDLMTVNAYMGVDTVTPLYPYLKEGKGIFLLCKTSNPGSGDFQDLPQQGGETLYDHMASTVEGWGAPFVGESGFSAMGMVAGATYPTQFATIRERAPHCFFLIPGYGMQGGTGEDIGTMFAGKVRGVVNNSRGLLSAHRGKTEGWDFVEHTKAAVRAMKEDIEKWL